MSCRRLNRTTSAPERWHRLWCPDCRQARDADAAIDAMLAEMHAEPLPTDGLEQTLAALRLGQTLPAAMTPGPSRRWLRVRAATAGVLAMALLVAFALALRLTATRPASYQPQPEPTVAQEARPGQPRQAHVPAPPAPRPPVSMVKRPALPGRGVPPTPDRRVVASPGSDLRSPPGSTPLAQGEQAMPDEAYLDGRDPELMAFWSGRQRAAQGLEQTAGRVRPEGDDFVFVPYPRLASAARDRNAGVAAAVRQYEKEKRVVDERLFRKVTLQAKAESLAEVSRALQEQTGVQLRASRGVADDKATVLVKELPARDVMRALARLFGYHWLRSGEPGAYRYELAQDLRSQLTEEELRNQDRNGAIVALDEGMKVWQPYLGNSIQELREMERTAVGEAKQRLQQLTRPGGLGAASLYRMLTPEQMAALLDGRELTFGTNPWQTYRLPEELRQRLLDSSPGLQIGTAGGPIGLRPPGDATPDGKHQLQPCLKMKLNRSELGQVTLEAASGMEVGGGAIYHGWQVLAVGRSPSAARPENGKANQALRSQPAFQRQVTIRPQPSCPKHAPRPGQRPQPAATSPQRPVAVPYQVHRRVARGLTQEPHVVTADVWQALHQATGLPIVADSFMRLHRLPEVTVENESLFEALCRVGDQIGVRWRKDGNFLLCRSTAYYWNRLKDVPNRLLVAWQKQRQENGSLSFDEVLEMAGLPDPQLDSDVVGDVVHHCWGIEEWDVWGVPAPEMAPRPWARLLRMLPRDQRARVREPEGLPVAELPPAVQQELIRLLVIRHRQPPAREEFASARLRADYVPPGWQILRPRWDKPVVSAPTVETALAAARKVNAGVQSADITQTAGLLRVNMLWPGGRFEALCGE